MNLTAQESSKIKTSLEGVEVSKCTNRDTSQNEMFVFSKLVFYGDRRVTCFLFSKDVYMSRITSQTKLVLNCKEYSIEC